MNLAADRKTRLWLSSIAGVALVAAIAVTANVLSHFIYMRLDLSRGRVYSVSTASKNILRSLPDNILVNVYYSKELPTQIAVSKNYLRDLLKEFSSASHGKVRTRFLEVGEDPKVRDEAVREGIAPVRFDIISKEKYEQQEGFLGLTLRYQDKKEVIGYLQSASGLEYDLISRIKVMSSPSKSVLGFVSGYQATTSDSLDPAIREALRTRYELKPVDLASVSVDSGIPAEIGTLFLIGPQSRIPDKDIFLLDQYLLSGRSLCVLVDSKRVDTRSFFASDIDTGLAPWLGSHGIGVEPTLVFDAQAQMIKISMQQGPFMIANIVQYPPIVIASHLNAQHPVTKGLDAVTLPFVSPIQISTRPAAAGGTQPIVDVLAQSSKYSWTKNPASSRAMMINPIQFPPPAPEDPKGPFVLAAAMEDRFSPFWPAAPPGVKAKTYLTQAAKPGRLVVIGTSKFLGGEVQVGEGNANFFLNLVDWLAQDADLIAIRSKSVAFHPLREIPAYAKTAIRYVNMLLPPLVAVMLGLWRWRARRKYRLAVQVEFAPHPTLSPAGVREIL